MSTNLDRSAWSADLVRPTPIIAAAALAVNDHVLKGAGWLPPAVTGKLSDVAGLLLAGIVAVTLARGAAVTVTGALPRRDGRLAVSALLAVALGFSALKLWPAFNAAVARVWGVNVLDPSDLWALPMLAVSFAWLRDREASAEASAIPRRFVRALVMLAVLLVCAATPAPPPVPPPPVAAWTVPAEPSRLACGEVVAWVSKSGKTGVGLTLRVTPAAGAGCEVAITTAALRFADASIPGREVPLGAAARPPASAPSVFHYIAFELDNERRWNRGERSATFELELVVAGARRRWTLPATHVFVQPELKQP